MPYFTVTPAEAGPVSQLLPLPASHCHSTLTPPPLSSCLALTQAGDVQAQLAAAQRPAPDVGWRHYRRGSTPAASQVTGAVTGRHAWDFLCTRRQDPRCLV